MEISSNVSDETNFATIAHELGHLYCGQQGTPNPKWRPERLGLKHDVREFEAESVSYIVCKRFGINSPSELFVEFMLNAILEALRENISPTKSAIKLPTKSENF